MNVSPYTVSQLSKLSGISPRTLRHYDAIGLLKPAFINASGYRLYGDFEVDRLQQILFYKTLGLPLNTITMLLDDDAFRPETALISHKHKLLAKKLQIERLINNVDMTLEALNGGKPMKDEAKFEGFKAQMISNNEKEYGKEIRERYGNKAIDRANENLLKKDITAYNEIEDLTTSIIEKLITALNTKESSNALEEEIFLMHKAWLTHWWGYYSAEAHKALADMYVSDERFKAYYDQHGEGITELLRSIINKYAK